MSSNQPVEVADPITDGDPTPPLKAFDGCAEHHVGTKEVNERWGQVETLIAATPEDDHAAQWSKCGMCACCYGPLLLERFTDQGIGIGPERCTKCQ